MTKKRLLSFALALSMVLSLVTVPSMAVGENVPTITLKPVEFSVTDEIGYLDRDVAKQSVNIGDAFSGGESVPRGLDPTAYPVLSRRNAVGR